MKIDDAINAKRPRINEFYSGFVRISCHPTGVGWSLQKQDDFDIDTFLAYLPVHDRDLEGGEYLAE